mmetsp:Transcript_5506/g.8149  ORF Transcript_5506/g.8149 Transcript_5506/m.8149 type:complete len:402 (-) Transcript_5506:343-1548(-)
MASTSAPEAASPEAASPPGLAGDSDDDDEEASQENEARFQQEEQERLRQKEVHDEATTGIYVGGTKVTGSFKHQAKPRLIEVKLPLDSPDLKEFERFRLGCSGLVTTSEGGHAWGENSNFSIIKIYYSIENLVGFDADSFVSDWGAGAGAFLYGARHFLPPSIRKLVSLVGIEDDKAVFKALTKSVEKYESIHGRDEKLTIAHGNSARIHGWCLGSKPVTHSVQYDGPGEAWALIKKWWKDIMRALFSMPSMRCIFSTKMNHQTFNKLFCDSEDPDYIEVAIGKWSLVKILGLSQGNAHHMGYLWIRDFMLEKDESEREKIVPYVAESSVSLDLFVEKAHANYIAMVEAELSNQEVNPHSTRHGGDVSFKHCFDRGPTHQVLEEEELPPKKKKKTRSFSAR